MVSLRVEKKEVRRSVGRPRKSNEVRVPVSSYGLDAKVMAGLTSVAKARGVSRTDVVIEALERGLPKLTTGSKAPQLSPATETWNHRLPESLVYVLRRKAESLGWGINRTMLAALTAGAPRATKR